MLRPILPLALVVLIGCSSAPPAPAGSPTDTAPAGTATPASAGPTAAPKSTRAPAPKTVDDCKALAASSTSDDPSATTAEATGSSDRSAAMTELMKQKRPGFRCCFDIWADKIPEAKLYTKVALSMEIGPSGKLKKATAQAEENGPSVSQEVQGCLADVAGSLTYPTSASGKDTRYTYHFDFKPKSRR